MQQAENSLRRLQTDYIDVYYAHLTDPNTPIEESLDAFDILIRQGKVRYCALSNFLGYETVEAILKAEKLGLHAPVCVQNSYSFIDRGPEMEVLPACRRFGLSFFGYSPVAGGLLGGAGVLERQITGRQRWGGMPLREDEARIIMWWDAKAKEAGVPPGQLALAWQLQKPGVTGVIIGRERFASLETSWATLDLDLPSGLFESLEHSYAEAKGCGASIDLTQVRSMSPLPVTSSFALNVGEGRRSAYVTVNPSLVRRQPYAYSRGHNTGKFLVHAGTLKCLTSRKKRCDG